MVGLVHKLNFKTTKFTSLNHVMGLSSFFFNEKKVRSFFSLSGRPSGLSARLKLQADVTWSKFANFVNLTTICTTKSTILNTMALFKIQR